MKKTIFVKIFAWVGLLGLVILPSATFAATDLWTNLTQELKPIGETAFQTLGAPVHPVIIVARAVKVILGLLGIILVCLIIYAGFLWMTAGGDAEQTKKAASWLQNSVIGLFIILAAYVIASFVITLIQTAVKMPVDVVK